MLLTSVVIPSHSQSQLLLLSQLRKERILVARAGVGRGEAELATHDQQRRLPKSLTLRWSTTSRTAVRVLVRLLLLRLELQHQLQVAMLPWMMRFW